MKAARRQHMPVFDKKQVYKRQLSYMKSSTDKGWKKRNNNIALQIKELSQTGSNSYVLFSYSNFLKESAKKEMSAYRKQISKIKFKISKKSIKAKKKRKLKVTVFPTSIKKKPTLKSSNKRIATINKKGVIKAKKKGVVTISASLYGKKKQIRIKVK